MRFISSLIVIIFSIQLSLAQDTPNPLLVKDSIEQQKWVNTIYDGMTLQEKIGQLYMVQVYSEKKNLNKAKIVDLIFNQKIGGIIYTNGDPVSQAKLNNELQAASKIPLLIGMDAEWGLSMRLDSTYAFPYNMTLGAITDNKLVERTGKAIGEHCRRLGVHFNFAPDVDVNTNPKNPIIGSRSFGEDRENVTNKASAFMKGMHDAGVLSSAKHFPGHGDTDSDSHKTLPTINFNKQRIDSIELYPYRRLIKEGVSSVMVAHLNVPGLEPNYGVPSSLSSAIIQDLLKTNLKFKGLIFTDALAMKGVANYKESSEVDLAAFLAGNDILLMSDNVEKGMAKLTEAYTNNLFNEERLAHSVKKILMAKYKVGLQNYTPVGTTNLLEDLNRLKDDLLYEELMEHAITVTRSVKDILPLRNLETRKIAYVKFGDDDGSVFLNELKKYTKVHEITAPKLDEMITSLQQYNTVIIGLHKSNATPWKSYQFSDQELIWLYEIARTNTVILDVFAKPYALSDLKSVENIEGIVMSYQNSNIAQRKSAQLIFGGIPSKGSLPVSAGENFKVGDGIKFPTILSLSYGLPERVGMSSEKLKKLDSMALLAIDHKTTPGLQLLVARKGKVIYNKSFGTHIYDEKDPVKLNDLYDVASLTKILATLPMIMELEDKGIVSIDSKLGQMLPSFRNSNKKNITLKEVLSHYGRLKPWVPFYVATLDSAANKKPSARFYRRKFSENYSVKVAEEVYLQRDYPDTIMKYIKDSDLLPSQRYKYSDLGYFILKEYIETHYDKPLDQLVQEHFYHSLGANYTTYNPSNIFTNANIVPSEEDNYYRYQRIQGYVHDMGAAMQGGVGGHAGIFSNSNDVAKIMQMYLQKGFFGGKRYFSPETLDKFNFSYYSGNRRGLGFDKPQSGGGGSTSDGISMKSFGHTGFTGTMAWADPEKEIVYVFLSNRTYPDANNNLLLKENIRTEIQRLIYDAIIE